VNRVPENETGRGGRRSRDRKSHEDQRCQT
jgi:hypothetical protein